MKKLTIKYNPYHLRTEILVNGKKPKTNSRLHFHKLRLQEWVELLPEILVDECNDRDYEITFVGTAADYSDLRSVLSESAEIRCTFEIDEKPSIVAVEKEIMKIYDDIQEEEAPVDALKDASIKEAFETARNQEFEVNVVATMSSGKSTLINALLGKDILPSAQKATTSKIVRITHTNQPNLHAIAFDANGLKIREEMDICYDQMKAWNDDPTIASINLYCPIPCVKSIGMRLVLLDTPGPNNAQDEQHQAVTYGMLNNSPKSLVLFVLNKSNTGTTDEKSLLKYVADTMAKGGKLSRERFLFAVSQMDTCRPGRDFIEEDLIKTREALEKFGIEAPNIFPVAALPALKKRERLNKDWDLRTFLELAEEYAPYRLEQYYSFNHLPYSAKKDIERWADGKSINDAVEIHTGIVSIEQAIRLYVDKYARPLKVRDLVDSFNNRLTKLNSIAELENKIRESQEFKAELDAKISAVKARIADGKQAKQFADDIEKANIVKSLMDEIMSYLGQASSAVREIRRSYGENRTDVPKSQAISEVDTIRKKALDILSQLDARIANILEEGYKELFENMVSQFKRSLTDLSISINDGDFELNPLDFAAEELSELRNIIDDKTKRIIVREAYTTDVDNPDKHWYNPLTWFKPSKIPKTVPAKWGDVVNMDAVIEEYLTPVQEQLLEARKASENHIHEESERIKSNILEKTKEISKLIEERLSELANLEGSQSITKEQIETQEKKLVFLRSIKQRVDNLIKY